MPYFRNVVADDLPFEVINVVVGETVACTRLLCRLEQYGENLNLCKGSYSELLNEKDKLAVRISRKYFLINGDRFVVFSEAFLDKESEEFKRIWVPGVHFVFRYEYDGVIKIDPKGALTYFTKRNSAELSRSRGGVWFFDIWVRDQKAPLTKCCRSITTAPNTLLITNIEDLGEAWPASEVTKGGNSKWLNLAYRLIPESSFVKTDEDIWFKFEVLDGRTLELATDVSWDNYRIEAVDGYAPHKRFAVEKGIGRFRVCALKLWPGEQMRVKVNGLFQTSLAEAVVNVC